MSTRAAPGGRRRTDAPPTRRRSTSCGPRPRVRRLAHRPDRRRHRPHAARARQPRHRRPAPALRVRRGARPRRPPPARPLLPPGLVGLPAVPAHPLPATTPSSRPASGRPTTSRTCPVIIVACVHGRRPCSPRSAPPPSTRASSPPCRTSSSARAALGLGGAASTLPLWSPLGGPPDPRPPAARHPGRGGAARAAREASRPRAPVAPVGNLVHLDRYGHQPFRGHARH